MTSRERVMAAFAHQEPDRVPCWCGASAEFWDKAKRHLRMNDEAMRLRLGDDFRRVSSRYVGPALTPSTAGATCRSVFGIERQGLGYGQPLAHPLQQATTVREVDAYPWPDPTWNDVSRIRGEALAWNRQYAVLGGEWSPFWHDAIDLLGMEHLCLCAYDRPEVLDAVLRHLVDYYAAGSQQVFEAAGNAIDIFFIGNDFGSQTGPLMGAEMFERFFVPHLKRLIGLGHAFGLKVMLHCCGGIRPLIPSLIKAALDGLHAVQPCCGGMDLRRLKADFGDQMLFNGAIDSQHVLIEGTPDSVRASTLKVLRLMMPGGGYVAGASHDTILEETPVENVLAMFDTIREAGGYR
ncbi:MAG: uroporphyrinogen decarboxylase family protein [Kiritimatiellae bacterium]|nr:uroporphyrinogen decarboxylase family protein [Kiritimatiellia bacterium]